VPKLTIVGLGGSLASNSKSRAALQTAVEGAARASAATCLLDIKTLGEEVVRVAGRFAADDSLHRQHECAQAAERVAAVA